MTFSGNGAGAERVVQPARGHSPSGLSLPSSLEIPREGTRCEEGAASIASPPGVLSPGPPDSYRVILRIAGDRESPKSPSTSPGQAEMLSAVMARTRPVPEGGTLGIFAGSGPYEPALLEEGLNRLRARGFSCALAPDLQAREGFLAGPDDHRLSSIRSLVLRRDVDALVAARGGYGLTRIIDQLEPELFRAKRKPLLGFSDVTALHVRVLGGRLDTIHGPVVTQLAKLDDATCDAVAETLRGRPPRLSLDGPVLQPGPLVEGPIWGGNLAVLAAMVGTSSFHPPEAGGLLLLEDVGETTYRLDRQVTQLIGAGVLDQVSGVILGDFHNCRPAQETHPTAMEVMKERLGGRGVPIVAGAPVGHGTRNMPVPLGRRARLDPEGLCLEIIE